MECNSVGEVYAAAAVLETRSEMKLYMTWSHLSEADALGQLTAFAMRSDKRLRILGTQSLAIPASGIEARSDATPKSGAAEGESVPGRPESIAVKEAKEQQ